MAPADKLRCRLWLALIDGFVEDANIDVAWRIASAIDAQWRAFRTQMYAEGYEGVTNERERQSVVATERQQLTDLERALLEDQPTTLH